MRPWRFKSLILLWPKFEKFHGAVDNGTLFLAIAGPTFLIATRSHHD
jgi:hypothetical protein